MDKRILKTKRALKDAMLRLLQKKNLESITATEICQEALTSRNTFYNYYSDKYALMEDCFYDLGQDVMKRFDVLQQQDAPQDRTVAKGFQNLIDAVMDAEDSYNGIPILTSFDLGSMYYRFLMQSLARIEEKYKEKYHDLLAPGYDYKQINAFLVLGIWGFIHANPSMSKEEIRTRTKRLAADLANSPIFADRS